VKEVLAVVKAELSLFCLHIDLSLTWEKEGRKELISKLFLFFLQTLLHQAETSFAGDGDKVRGWKRL